MKVVATWMYSSPSGENILHNQVGARSSSRRIQEFYWRCVFLLFESSARLNTDVRHILFVNKHPPASIDGIQISELIRQYSIEIVEFESITKSPLDYYSAWNTQFLVLDILDWLKCDVSQDDSVFVLDSDVLFVKPISDDVVQRIYERGALLYSIQFDHQNGLSSSQMLEISRELDPDFPRTTFVYAGGEFICLHGSQIGRVAERARWTFEQCMRRYYDGKIRFNEEAHLLTFVYHQLGYTDYSANDLIKRIWTDRAISTNIDGSERNLTVWHLPAEKKRGFVMLFRSLHLVEGRYTPSRQDLARLFRVDQSVIDIMQCAARRMARRILIPIRDRFRVRGMLQ